VVEADGGDAEEGPRDEDAMMQFVLRLLLPGPWLVGGDDWVRSTWDGEEVLVPRYATWARSEATRKAVRRDFPKWHQRGWWNFGGPRHAIWWYFQRRRAMRYYNDRESAEKQG
jgi:hypothetical protein